MPLVADPIVLDPADFVPNGAELDLSGAGFRVLDANFGDADVELEMQRQALGEVPSTYHPPNTTTVLALGVRAEEEIDLPTAAHQLAAKVGEINTPGTEHWLRRDFEVGGDFAGSLGKRVYKATLSGLGAWQRGDSPDVPLTLITGPYWYATVEAESGVFTSEAGARELILELAEILGTAPGLIRIRINNEGEKDWRGLILAGECRDHPQDDTEDTTAALAYAAADLTPKGGAEVKEVSEPGEIKKEGEDPPDVVFTGVEHASLSAGWLSILNSKIVTDDLGHMTHLGVRRFWVRAEAVGVEPNDVQLHLRWRPLGAIAWTDRTMPIVPLNIVGAYQLYDLGECRPEPAALGEQRWEWDLQARAVSGSGKVRLHRVWPLPTEQFMVVKAPGVSAAADAQSTKAAGTVANSAESDSGENAWSNPGDAKTSDNSRATVALSGELGANKSQYLKATNFGFELPEGATVQGIVASIERSQSGLSISDHRVRIVKGGGVVLTENKANFAPWPATGAEASAAYGGSADLWSTTWTPAQINAAGFGVALIAAGFGAGGTAQVDAISMTVYYTEAADENRICFAERAAEPRSDGIFRQHPEDDVWGELIPEGFLPYASPSGLEGRKSRFIVIPSRGDLDELPDSGSNPLSAQGFVRAGYHFAREAA